MKKHLQTAFFLALLLVTLVACAPGRESEQPQPTVLDVTSANAPREMTSTPTNAANTTSTSIATSAPSATSAAAADTPTATPAPAAAARAMLFAYYYIWFDPQSWDRAKVDLPQLGKYSSDDEAVMRQHVKWAKEAGIDGFIVGWKSSDKLDARLEKILTIADEENFKILMIYQALDFARNPLPMDKISADLDEFIAKYMNHPSLNVFSKPVMIWSGTWKFSAQQVKTITQSRRDKLLILGTSKTIKDYERIAASLDGNAYYWSSVNVDTNANYEAKLGDMADAIHRHNGLWIAPAAPGFDARLVGGTQVIDRKDGQTLRQQMSAASQASPDAIGLISWNEFSENSYVEPSVKYGRRYLDVLKEIRSSP
jgi:hypothetical protein